MVRGAKIALVVILVMTMVLPAMATTVTLNPVEDSLLQRAVSYPGSSLSSISTGAGTTINRDANTSKIYISSSDANNYAEEDRAFITFNLSSAGITSGDTLYSGDLKLWGYSKDSVAHFLITARLTNASPANPLLHVASDYNTYHDIMMSDTNKTRSSWSTTGQNIFTLNANGLDYIGQNLNGNVTFALRSGMDINHAVEGSYANFETAYMKFHSVDDTNSTLRPELTIVYNYVPDTTPPETITDLTNSTVSSSSIPWTWTNPDADIDHVMVYKNGVFFHNVTTAYDTWTGLTGSTTYTISTRAADASDNVNATWVNSSATTDATPIYGWNTTIFYPVVDSSDGVVWASSTVSFASLRAAAGDSSAYDWSPIDGAELIATTGGNYNHLSRGLLEFDTSTLPDDTKFNSVILRLKGTAKSTGLGSTSIDIDKFSPYYSGGSPIAPADYNSFYGSSLADNITSAGWSTSGDNNFTFTASGAHSVSHTGITALMTRLGWDKFNDQTGLMWSNGATTKFSYEDSHAGGSSRPYLEVNWSYSVPDPQFTSNGATGIFPTTTRFTDGTYYSPLSWSWQYRVNGTTDWTQFSTSQSPHYMFPIGTYDINLTTTNAQGSASIVETSYISMTAGRDPGDHPYLFFHSISEVPGYQNNGTAPWSTYETSIKNTAGSYLSLNPYGSASFEDGSIYAEYLALRYQITKEPAYGNRAIEWLTTMKSHTQVWVPSDWDPQVRYALAFDWVANQSGLNLMSESNYTKIRDNIAFYCDRSLDPSMDATYGAGSTSPPAVADRQANGYASLAIRADAIYGYSNSSTLATDWNDWKAIAPQRLLVSEPSSVKASYPNNGILWVDVNATSGFDSLGAYMYYFMGSSGSQTDGLIPFWMNEWSHFNSQNILDTYPGLKAMVMKEVYSRYPNGFNNNWATDGLTNHPWTPAVYSLLDQTNRSYVRWQNAQAATNTALFPSVIPYTTNTLKDWEYYLTVGNYNSESLNSPTKTRNLDPGIAEVMRSGWTNTSQWISLLATSQQTGSQRDMGHNDQLSIDYQANGVTLLPDGGEVKDTDTNIYNNPCGSAAECPGTMHNTLLIENPRSNWLNINDKIGGIAAEAPLKGDAYGNLLTPAYFDASINTQSMGYMAGHETFNLVESRSYTSGRSVGSNVYWSRGVMFPNNSYPIVIDYKNDLSGVTWNYKTLWRFGSYTLNKSWTPSAEGGYLFPVTGHLPTVGHVSGSMYVDGSLYDWANQSGGITNDTLSGEKLTGVTSGNSVRWQTTNPYGQTVNLNVFSAPAANITSSNFVSRIGGYSYTNEIKNPQVYFGSTTPTASEYRITALLPNYSTESGRTPSELTVTGTGSAIKVVSINGDTDRIYAGSGSSSFDTITTDADRAFIRTNSSGVNYVMIINGTTLTVGGSTIINQPSRPSYYEYGLITTTPILPVSAFCIIAPEGS